MVAKQHFASRPAVVVCSARTYSALPSESVWPVGASIARTALTRSLFAAHSGDLIWLPNSVCSHAPFPAGRHIVRVVHSPHGLLPALRAPPVTSMNDKTSKVPISGRLSPSSRPFPSSLHLLSLIRSLPNRSLSSHCLHFRESLVNDLCV